MTSVRAKVAAGVFLCKVVPTVVWVLIEFEVFVPVGSGTLCFSRTDFRTKLLRYTSGKHRAKGQLGGEPDC